MLRGIRCTGAALAGVAAMAQYGRAAIMFTKTTDTISIAGNTLLSDRATYEATLSLTSTTYVNQGFIFNAWSGGNEDEQFDIRNGALSAYAYPVVGTTLNGGSLSVNVPYDFAYVFDGSQERLYINGNMVASRSASGVISSGSLVTLAVGAIARDSGVDGGFLGSLQSLRISNSARYFGSSYTPNFGDFSNDTSTILLYDFDSTPVGGTVVDLSNNGHTGTLGAGFGGATSPSVFLALPEPSAMAMAGVAAGACLLRRRRAAW